MDEDTEFPHIIAPGMDSALNEGAAHVEPQFYVIWSSGWQNNS